MIGIILLAVLGLWGFICYWITRFLLGRVGKSSTRKITFPIIFLLVFLLPVADEIIGGVQFWKLCKEKSVLVVNEEKIKGRTVISQGGINSQLSGYILPIRIQYWSYRDKETGEILISWNDLYAKGGWLSRTIGFLDGNPPYTFDGSCLAKGGLDYVYNNDNFKVEIRK